jgi:hypothetical protein
MYRTFRLPRCLPEPPIAANLLRMRVAIRAVIATLIVGLTAGCSSDHATHGVVVGINEQCVFVEVRGQPNQCVPPHFNSEAEAARVGECFRIDEDSDERLRSAHSERRPSP